MTMLLLDVEWWGWPGEGEGKLLFVCIEPTESLNVLLDDILIEKDSLLERNCSSEDDKDGTKVATDMPMGYGATGMSESEDAEGL